MSESLRAFQRLELTTTLLYKMSPRLRLQALGAGNGGEGNMNIKEPALNNREYVDAMQVVLSVNWLAIAMERGRSRGHNELRGCSFRDFYAHHYCYFDGVRDLVASIIVWWILRNY